MQVLVISAAVLALSCQAGPGEVIPREDLYRLSIGKMEDQLDLFQLGKSPFHHKNDLYLRDGIFFISNGGSAKVMELTSFGDLLSLHYNPETNPTPILLKDSADGRITTRRAHPFSFNRVGEIAVSRGKLLYVEDQVPDERSIYDEQLGTVLNKIVLRFDSSGEFKGYLGQDGIGGTPFPFIQRIFITDNDEPVVISRAPAAWLVYWFSAEGELAYRVVIPSDDLPLPDEGNPLPSLETIIPDPSEKRLYLKLNYYVESVDAGTGQKVGIEKVFSRVWWLDVETGRYAGGVDVPENVRRQTRGSLFETEEVNYLFELVGAAGGGNLFLLSREENNLQQLIILNTSGAVIQRRYLRVEDDRLIYSVFFLSSEGILAALLADERQARVVWWRTDKLLSPAS